MTSKPLAVATIVILVFILALVGVQMSRANERSKPAEPGLATGVFEKGKPYMILFEEGLYRRWFLCKVQDAKDNWVKCDGGLVENGNVTEAWVGVWVNTDYVLRVSTK